MREPSTADDDTFDSVVRRRRVKPELRDATAIVGIGETAYHRRGGGGTGLEMGCAAILAALDDAGLRVEDVDGISYYASFAPEAAVVAEVLGIPTLRFSAGMTGGGGGSAGVVGLAAMAVGTGTADVVVSVHVSKFVPRAPSAYFAASATAETGWFDFITNAGLIAPGQMFAIMARRHMHEFGTTREHFAEVAVSTRANASTMEAAVMRDPITFDDYFNARMISDPLCLFDYCLQTDGAAAVVTTSAERAADLRQRPVYIRGTAQGGEGAWGQGEEWLQMPDEIFASAGCRSVARDLYASAGVGPAEVDVAELYDHFTAMVIMQLEDFGFCERGEGGPFVEGGRIRRDGALPVNTHGGSHSYANLNGMTHIPEAVRQLRGTATNQVPEAEVALVSGGPGKLPMSALLLRR
jgi:acetyl-CoA acetyltransferase